MIRVLLVDDHGLMRQGLQVLLTRESDIEIIGEADDGRKAIDKVELLRPDVVLMDISMAGFNGLDATQVIHKRVPTARVVMLSMHASEEYVLHALRSGAHGYVLKQDLKEELLLAIRAAYKGEQYLSPRVSQSVIQSLLAHEGTKEMNTRVGRLTVREREILQLVGEGYSNPEIAQRLVISPKTVERHKANLMSKLDIHSTAGLVRFAIENGLVRLDK